MVYEGMNAEFYTGMKVPYYHPQADLSPPKPQFQSEPQQSSSPSGSSSHTALSARLDDPTNNLVNLHHDNPPQRYGSRDLGAPLPIRRRQRKPDRKAKPYELEDISSTAAKKKTPGKRGRPAAGTKAKRTASATEDLAQRVPASPRQPLPPRELPARHTPRKQWQDEEAWEAAPRRTKSVHFAEAALPSPVRRVKAAAAPRARQPSSPSTKGAQKDGGPCAVCYVTKSATWRRGALGGRHSGLPLCNKCGVWEFRHPESPARDEMEIEFASNRRRTNSLNAARRIGLNRRSSDEDRLDRSFSAQPSLDPHPQLNQDPNPPLAEAAMLRSHSDDLQPLQPWEGNNLVAPVYNTLQHLQHAPPAASGVAQRFETAAVAEAGAVAAAAAADSVVVKVEPMDVEMHAASKKRRGDDLDEPVAKRWQIEAYAGGLEGHVAGNAANGMQESGGAAVDCFDCGRDKVEVAQPVRHRIHLKVKMPVNRAATEQHRHAPGLV